MAISSTNVVGVDFFKMVSDFSTALSSDTRSNIDRAISELSSAQKRSQALWKLALNSISGKTKELMRIWVCVDQMLSSEEDLSLTQFNAELVRLEATQELC